MVCCVLSDMTGASASVTDKDVREHLRDLNALYDGKAYEAEERTVTVRRLFRKPRQYKTYALYWYVGVGVGEWQLLRCASGRKEQICAYMIGEINGIRKFKKPKEKVDA